MDRVLKADTAIAVARTIQARQHLELHLLAAACLHNNVALQRM